LLQGRGELGYSHIQRGLGDGVAHLPAAACPSDKGEVGCAGGERDNLLCGARAEEREKGVGGMNGAKGIDPKLRDINGT
jgi:hypothetical protein